MNTPLTWTEQDAKAVDIARVLAADAVEKVGNGHPGTAISLAPAAYLLYQKVMKGDPADDRWVGRDRFIMSAGHASLTQYNQLFLAGYGLEAEDIASLRVWGSLTPGHPEYGHTKGIECTTGPLGAGISNMVGMAIAAKRERAILDPDAPEGESIFDRTIFAIAGDGCMQEGVAAEAASMAGALGLGNIVLIYDDNRITIEGETKIAFTEDVLKRHEAYGWHTQHVDWTNGGKEYKEDVQALYDAILAAQAVTDKPSIIKLTTIIAWPLPTKQGHHSTHGSKIGGDEIKALKELLGMDPEVDFPVDPEILKYTRKNAADRAAEAKSAWQAKYDEWRAANPDKGELFDRLVKQELPADFEQALPVFEAGKAKATRAASGEVLSALADAVPELFGGSADLAGSNNTTMKGQPSFLAPGVSTEDWQGDHNGRTLHFGIREHAMGGIVNGIALSGLTRPYCGTFLVFSDYMRPTARLAALQNIPSTFVWTHDSIGVGEDGPTHQPIEHLAALRAIPNFDVVRPADANETAAAWAQILKNKRAATIILSRQNLPVFDRDNGFASTAGVAKGAYTLVEASAAPKVILIGTGSEVQLAVEAAKTLEAEGIPARVVSMPCVEWFNEQDEAYRNEVLPKDVVKVSVEAGVKQGWREIVGDSGRIISIDHFGASADGALLFEKFGITADAVVAAAKDALA